MYQYRVIIPVQGGRVKGRMGRTCKGWDRRIPLQATNQSPFPVQVVNVESRLVSQSRVVIGVRSVSCSRSQLVGHNRWVTIGGSAPRGEYPRGQVAAGSMNASQTRLVGRGWGTQAFFNSHVKEEAFHRQGNLLVVPGLPTLPLAPRPAEPIPLALQPAPLGRRNSQRAPTLEKRPRKPPEPRRTLPPPPWGSSSGPLPPRQRCWRIGGAQPSERTETPRTPVSATRHHPETGTLTGSWIGSKPTARPVRRSPPPPLVYGRPRWTKKAG